MATFVIPNVFVPQTVADANAVNANFTAIENAINAGIPAGALVSTIDMSALNWYNYFNFGAIVNGGSAQNGTAFSAMLSVMAALNGGSGGGRAYIPAGTFPIAPGPYIIPDQSVFEGAGVTVANAGGSGGPVQMSLSMAGDGTLFSGVYAHTPGGPKIRNIGFGCVGATLNTTTCFNAGLWSLSVQDCVFEGWPTMLYSANGLGTSWLRNVYIYNGALTNTTAIVLDGSTQCEISGPSEMIGNSIPGTSTFCSIGGGEAATQHNVLRNLHITGWNYGIDWSDVNGYGVKSGTQNDIIDGCLFDCFAYCIYMVPGASGPRNLIADEKIINCTLAKSQASTSGAPLVYIDTNGGAASLIGPVLLSNNLIYSNVSTEGVAQQNQYGVQIGTCEAVTILGGQISQVGTVAGNDGSANVCISGNPMSVTMEGVNLAPSYAGSKGGSGSGAGQTQYALLITGSPAGPVTVNNCPMIGFSLPVKVTVGLPIQLEVTNCAGYNDQGTIVTTSMPTSGVYVSAQTIGAVPYFGPVTFEVTGGTITSIAFSENTTASEPSYASPLTSGTFTLSPGQFVKFNYTGSPTIVMVGR